MPRLTRRYSFQPFRQTLDWKCATVPLNKVFFWVKVQRQPLRLAILPQRMNQAIRSLRNIRPQSRGQAVTPSEQRFPRRNSTQAFIVNISRSLPRKERMEVSDSQVVGLARTTERVDLHNRQKFSIERWNLHAPHELR